MESKVDKPFLVNVVERVADGETHLECTFSDGQKFAGVMVDDALSDSVVRARDHAQPKAPIGATSAMFNFWPRDTHNDQG